MMNINDTQTTGIPASIPPENSDSVQVESVNREIIRQSYMNSPKVIIAGGRDFDDYDYMCECIDSLLHVKELISTPIKVVSGMAKGADTLGIRYADGRHASYCLLGRQIPWHTAHD